MLESPKNTHLGRGCDDVHGGDTKRQNTGAAIATVHPLEDEMEKMWMPLLAVAMTTACEHTIGTEDIEQRRANEIAEVVSESVLVALVYGDRAYLEEADEEARETVRYEDAGHRDVVGSFSSTAEMTLVQIDGLTWWMTDGSAVLDGLGKDGMRFSGEIDFQFRIDPEQADALQLSGELSVEEDTTTQIALVVSMDAMDLDAPIFFEGTVDGVTVDGAVSSGEAEVEEDPYEECRAPVGVDCG